MGQQEQGPAGLPAGFDEAFADFDYSVPIDVHDPKVNAASNQNGLSDFQRFAVKNFFDTQIARRRVYMKKLGYEIDEEGDNYRPIGSDGSYQPIDPGGVKDTILAIPKLFSEEGRREVAAELWRDTTDLAYDVGVAGPMIGSMGAVGGGAGALKGAAAGASIGAAVTAPTGPGAAAGAAGGAGVGGLLGGILGTIAGASTGNAMSETMKLGIGNFLLDESVPVNMQELVYQSLVTGTLSGLGKLGSEGVKKLKAVRAEDLQKALKEAAIRKSNGTFNAKLAEDLAMNPAKYTPEAVKGSQEKLLHLADDIFGTSAKNPKSTRDLTGGVAKDAIEGLNSRADLEIEKLSKMKDANFTVDEVVKTVRSKVEHLTGKLHKTQDEERALAFLNDELKSLKAKTALPTTEAVSVRDPITGLTTTTPSTGGGFKEMNFKEGRDLLKRWQNAAYEEGPVKDNGTMKALAAGLKELADEKAGALGSDLPKINAQRSRVLKTYYNLQQALSPAQMQAAYVGKDSVAKNNVRRVLQEADDVLGTRLGEAAESTQFKAVVEKFFDNPSSFGSGSVFSDMMREGLRQGKNQAIVGSMAGSTAGMPFGFSVAAKTGMVGGAIGGVHGFAKGVRDGASFSSPDTLINSMSKVRVRIDELAKGPGSYGRQALRGILSPAAQVGAQSEEFMPRLESLQGPPQEAAMPQPSPLQPPAQQETPQAASLPEGFDEAFKDFDYSIPEGL
jgi:hypothetical protein